MGLNDNGHLAVAELVFWVPATAAGALVSFRHGFVRQLGWIFIVLLGIARIIGASCTIAAQEETHPDSGVLTAAAITNGIGLSFLIQCILGLMQRVNGGLPDGSGLPPRMLHLLNILLIVGIILGIVGGTNVANGPQSSDYNSGVTEQKASSALFAAGFGFLVLIVVLTVVHYRKIVDGERRLLLASIVALPFILVRLIYSLIVVFDRSGDFSLYSPNVWIKAFMAIMEEFVVAVIVLVVGFLTPVIPHGQVKRGGQEQQGYEINAPPVPPQPMYAGQHANQEYGYATREQV